MRPEYAGSQHGLGLHMLQLNAGIPPYNQQLGGVSYPATGITPGQLSERMNTIEITAYSPKTGVAGDQVVLLARSHSNFLASEETEVAMIFHSITCPIAIQPATSDPNNGIFQYTLCFRIPQIPLTNRGPIYCAMQLSVQSHCRPVSGLIPIGHFILTSTNQFIQPNSSLPDSLVSVKHEGYQEPSITDNMSSRRSSAMFSHEGNASGLDASPQQPQIALDRSVPGSASDAIQVQRSRSHAYHTTQSSQSVAQVKRSSSVAFRRSSEDDESAFLQGGGSTQTVSEAQASPDSAAMQPRKSSPLTSDIAASSNPTLVRTSTLNIVPGPAMGNYGSTSASSHKFNPYAMSPSKAFLKIDGELDRMTSGWSEEEKATKRRLVEFRRSQKGNTITATFKPVTLEQRAPNSICVSCIWWEEKEDCFVTSVDTIQLLESLVGVRFTVEEKNRIRRNLEGFRPLTVAKGKCDSERFFKIVMDFPNPKPRNIEKDVKVFPWKILANALKKIIGKYVSRDEEKKGGDLIANCSQSASYASTASSLHPSSALEYANTFAPGEPARFSGSPISQGSSTLSVGQGSVAESATDSSYLQTSAAASAPAEYHPHLAHHPSYPPTQSTYSNTAQQAQYTPYGPVSYSWPQQEQGQATRHHSQQMYPPSGWRPQYALEGSPMVSSPQQFGPIQPFNLPLQQRQHSQASQEYGPFLRHGSQP